MGKCEIRMTKKILNAKTLKNQLFENKTELLQDQNRLEIMIEGHLGNGKNYQNR